MDCFGCFLGEDRAVDSDSATIGESRLSAQTRRRPASRACASDFSAIVYVLRTGCQWKALPSEFGSASAVHKHLQQRQQAGFFRQLWQAGLVEYDEMQGVAWNWQSIDGAMHKAPLATEYVGPNPTDRGKNGRKRSLLVDGIGVPLSLVASGANTHDIKLLEATLDQVVMEIPGRA